MSGHCAPLPCRCHKALLSSKGGSLGVAVLVAVVLVAGMLVAGMLVAGVLVTGVLVAGVLVSVDVSGTLGMGQVTSLASSGQNSLIFWKKYH